ncbi:hypothetical protein EDB92DRAFT_1946522 [Lactarius akahatsu]|uniref:Glucose receptor Git3 N-terminal domain-containing protein n=1 Tax=Lactarius akahatsu TaxID=416441 RepID=A0AAD4LED2_9AGAM|nr:hypothetical protein EDB92DRAFT_1946522 [Lactarius akahatsu]
MSDSDGVHGTVCNAEEYLNKTITCLTHGQSIGLALTAEASFLSLAAVIIALALTVRNVLRYRKAHPNGGRKLLRVSSDIYLLSLFAYDILQALGGILDVRWAHNGIVTVGSYCTAQGVIQQSGELGVALITLIITVHTFVVALWEVKFIEARRFAFGMVALASLFVVLWVGIGNGIHKDLEAPTPYWCWIGDKYNLERLAGEYIWLWIALSASVIMYIPLYFWMNGRRLSTDPKKWYKFRLSKSNDQYAQRRSALGMLSYPIAYSLVVLPVSIVRAINVLLFLIVRRELLLFSSPEEYSGHEGELDDDVAKSSPSPQPTEMGLADDRAWNLTADGNDVALSRINSRPRSDGI